MPKLAYTTHTGQRSEVEIGPNMPVVLVGRLAECQIQTVDTSVSRKHSQFTWKPGDFVEVQDLNSSNGTFVNDARVSSAQLNNADKVRCGNFLVEYMAVPSQVAQPPGGRMGAPPSAAAPTRFGPGASGLGGSEPPGGGGGIPYVDDPSMAMAPEAVNAAYSHVETVDSRHPSAPQPSVPSGLSSDQLREELERALRRVDALGREVDELRYENQRLRSSGGGGPDSETTRRLEAENRRLREENDSLYEERKESDRMKAQMDALSDRNVELKEQFTSLQDQQSELRDKLREAREDLETALFKRDELSSDVERLEADKTELFDQLTKLKIEYNHMERANEATQKEFGLMEFEYKRLDEANQELERELRAQLDGESEQTDSLNRLQNIVDEKENVITDLREQLDEIKEELREQEGADSSWLVEVEKLKQENEELLADNDELLEKIDDLRDVMSAQKATSSTESEGMAEDLQNLKDENERLHSRLKDYVSADAYDKIQADNDELRVEINKLNKKLDEAGPSTPSGAEELLSQIRELTSANHKLEAKLRAQSATTDTNPGNLKAVTPDAPDKTKEVFKSINSMVSAWRANLETMQIHVGDLSSFYDTVSGIDLDGDAKDKMKKAVTETDPDWAFESMGETVKQILGDSKKIKGMLLELREEIAKE